MSVASFLRVVVVWAVSAVAGAAGPLPGTTLMDEAFEAAQWAHLSSAGTALRQLAARRAAGNDALAELLQERQVLQDRVGRAEAELAALGGETAGENLAEAARLGGEIDAARSALGLLDDQLTRDHPGFGNMISPATLSVAEVQQRLQADEGLVFIYTGARRSFVWAITPTRSGWYRVDLSLANIAESVTEIRRSLIQATTLRSAAALEDDEPAGVPFAAVHAMLLYSELLRPVETVLEGANHVYTVVNGPLTGLPLSLLITDGQVESNVLDQPDQFRRAGWWIRKHALTTLPSVEALDLVVRAEPVATDGFVGFGDPDFSGGVSTPAGGTFFRSGGADLDSLRALAPLPGTRRELRRLAGLLDAGPEALHLGGEASETVLRAAPLDKARIIAFATHGLLSGELRGLAEPALAFTPPDQVSPEDDGLLTASEIANLSLDADWVILSACNTAGSDGSPDAEGLSGLARAFLFAGARTLMVSHWPVRDDAAARLTTGTFASLEDGTVRRKAAALQSSMLALLNDLDAPDLAHPAAWAPFVLVGDGG